MMRHLGCRTVGVTRTRRVVNRDRNFLATVFDKIEIAGEFVLIFNKFGPMMALEPGRSKANSGA
jgi:hypothetical protein